MINEQCNVTAGPRFLMRKVLETLMPLRVPVSSLTWTRVSQRSIKSQDFQGNQDHVTHISPQAVLLTGQHALRPTDIEILAVK